MQNLREWPEPTAMADAFVSLLRQRLDEPTAQHIVLTRDEAALCLGLIAGLAELLHKARSGSDRG
jgi:hypothetical protein